MSGPTAFQKNAFQNNAFQIAAGISSLTITETISKLQLPINCVVAGDQPEENPRKFDVDMFGILKRIIFRE